MFEPNMSDCSCTGVFNLITHLVANSKLNLHFHILGKNRPGTFELLNYIKLIFNM